MENSAYEALMIGLNITVFIVALTISINLMMNVREMSEKANEVITKENGSLVEIQGNGTPDAGIPGISDELNTYRIYSGADLLSYYKDDKYRIRVELHSGEYSLDYTIESFDRRSIIRKNFILEYIGIGGADPRLTYKFIEI